MVIKNFFHGRIDENIYPITGSYITLFEQIWTSDGGTTLHIVASCSGESAPSNGESTANLSIWLDGVKIAYRGFDGAEGHAQNLYLDQTIEGLEAGEHTIHIKAISIQAPLTFGIMAAPLPPADPPNGSVQNGASWWAMEMGSEII